MVSQRDDIDCPAPQAAGVGQFIDGLFVPMRFGMRAPLTSQTIGSCPTISVTGADGCLTASFSCHELCVTCLAFARTDSDMPRAFQSRSGRCRC